MGVELEQLTMNPEGPPSPCFQVFAVSSSVVDIRIIDNLSSQEYEALDLRMNYLYCFY